MSKIGLFWGSDTGNTEKVARMIEDLLGNDNVDLHDIANSSTEDIEKYELLIFGASTWYDGDLQSDWDAFFDNLDAIDFNGKTVALFGLGDQYDYAEYFIDGVGILYDKIIERGAKVIGEWSTEGYEYDVSKAERDGVFVGLALDEDNQEDLTEERVKQWIDQIKPQFGL